MNRRTRWVTPASSSYPKRPYDLVREVVLGFLVVLGLTIALAALFSSPDRPALTLSSWAKAAPADVVATATSELAGTSTTAGYGPPYNSAGPGQRLGVLDGRLGPGTSLSSDTRRLLLLADGSYLADQAQADHLSGDQWGMMNEAGNYPGQPWLWLYTFWYQVPSIASSANADLIVVVLMGALTLCLICVPFIPGLRTLPRLLRIHKLIWRL